MADALDTRIDTYETSHGVVVYDSKAPRAWIQTDVLVSVAEMR